MERPEKIEIFMAMAYTISRLSLDSQTKHGCIITNQKHHIVGCGYNSFPRGMDDAELERRGYTTRPAKYPWMIHSERNAVSNCEHTPENGVAYVTGVCCTDCIMHLWQNGVETVYMLDRHSVMLDAEQDKRFTEFIELTKFKPPHVGMRVYKIKPSLNFLLPMVNELRTGGFIDSELDIKDGLSELLINGKKMI